MSDADTDDTGAKRICHLCVEEPYLAGLVRSTGRALECSYCERTGETLSIAEVADMVDVAFEQHYDRTSDQPSSTQLTLLGDRESNYDWARSGEEATEAIAMAAQIEQEPAEDIRSVLEDRHYDHSAAEVGEESPFSEDSHYAGKRISDFAWQAEWDSFERALKTEARFFSRSAAAHLATVFDGIDKMIARDGRRLVVDGGPGTAFEALFRARVFQDDKRIREALCRPDRHLGPPPSPLASAGRMNARGISVFYGANSPDVALAEVRPPVGSSVAVARFQIVRPVRLLDLTALVGVASEGSLFDPGYATRLERDMFLRSLSARITMPVMPDDEAFEYLVTQAIADFLATEAAVPLDGIVFPSVQTGGQEVNVVLFHKAARGSELDVPPGTEISASSGDWYEDGFEPDYVVTESVPPVIAAGNGSDDRWSKDDAILAGIPWAPTDVDRRGVSLVIDLQSIRVHKVKAVSYETSSLPVSRRRSTRREPESGPVFTGSSTDRLS